MYLLKYIRLLLKQCLTGLCLNSRYVDVMYCRNRIKIFTSMEKNYKKWYCILKKEDCSIYLIIYIHLF